MIIFYSDYQILFIEWILIKHIEIDKLIVTTDKAVKSKLKQFFQLKQPLMLLKPCLGNLNFFNHTKQVSTYSTKQSKFQLIQPWKTNFNYSTMFVNTTFDLNFSYVWFYLCVVSTKFGFSYVVSAMFGFNYVWFQLCSTKFGFSCWFQLCLVSTMFGFNYVWFHFVQLCLVSNSYQNTLYMNYTYIWKFQLFAKFGKLWMQKTNYW